VSSQAPRHQHELPAREVFALPRGSMPRHRPENLRKIANDFDITKRRKFYDLAHELAREYYMDRIIEEDLLHSTWARTTFKRAIVNGSKLGRDIEEIFSNRPLFSMWNEPYFTCKGDLEEVASAFRRDEFRDQLLDFVLLTVHALSTVPRPPPSRKKMLALRKWAKGHLKFWTEELGRPVKVNHDPRDGYSCCHGLLRALLTEIDRSSLGALGTILRDRKTRLREESAPE
jgi:hypothetical protein